MNNPNCAIGKDAVEVNVEDYQRWKTLMSLCLLTEPAMRTGSYVTGMLCCWGTATAGNMQVFEQNFYSPKSFGFMPFENVWDKDCRNEFVVILNLMLGDFKVKLVIDLLWMKMVILI